MSRARSRLWLLLPGPVLLLPRLAPCLWLLLLLRSLWGHQEGPSGIPASWGLGRRPGTLA